MSSAWRMAMSGFVRSSLMEVAPCEMIQAVWWALGGELAGVGELAGEGVEGEAAEEVAAETALDLVQAS
jgi:hypothetical protein